MVYVYVNGKSYSIPAGAYITPAQLREVAGVGDDHDVWLQGMRKALKINGDFQIQTDTEFFTAPKIINN